MAFDLFQPKAPPLFGLDISSSSVKMLEIVDAGKGAYRVERYAIEPLPRDAVVDGNINNLEAVAESVKRAHKRLGTRTRHVAMAVPTGAVISKKIIVAASLPEAELELQVETEANQYIPFALEEVNLDFQALGPSASNPEEQEVLIAATRNPVHRQAWLIRHHDGHQLLAFFQSHDDEPAPLRHVAHLGDLEQQHAALFRNRGNVIPRHVFVHEGGDRCFTFLDRHELAAGTAR